MSVEQKEPVSEDVRNAERRVKAKAASDKLRAKQIKKVAIGEIKASTVRESYRAIFGTEAGAEILEDLKKVCFFSTPAYNDSERKTLLNLGKNQVIHHILEQIKPEEEEEDAT